ncbi:MAG: beta-galactosidase [Tepidisphaera sp.]
MRILLLASVLGLCSAALAQPQAAAQSGTPAWKPVEGKLMSKWAKDVDPKNPWPEYPRPTMVRERWQNLNGLWDYAILPSNQSDTIVKPDGQILVPFPVESALSGVGRRVTPDQTLHYKRTFTVPADWRTNEQRVLLHFGAVDWHAVVKVNGKLVEVHLGGYDPFYCDITNQLNPEGDNTLTVEVRDPTDTGGQPRGKQWADPHGIWYTPTTGIWQTVWIEPVPKAHLPFVGVTRADASGVVNFQFSFDLGFDIGDQHPDGLYKTSGTISRKGAVVAKFDGLNALVRDPELWSPDSPTLYDYEFTLEVKGAKDTVRGYLAFRDVKLAKDDAGVQRLFLNGKPTFMFGPLDQGFWPDGLYTPPTEAAMQFDIEAAKRMGCNMLRKHVKVESERFYYLCDKLGIMVWQDIPSPFFKTGTPKPTDENFSQPAISDAWKANFTNEMQQIIEHNRHHPSIVMWVPWNEGWGQNDLQWSKTVVDAFKDFDPSRLINCASGWTDTGNGDVLDIHIYPGPATTTLQKDRAVVLGEYGGLGLPIDGHTWQKKDNWGYVSYKSKEEVTKAYLDQLRQIPSLIAQGLAAAVYTQTTDVEIETNGWLTYDREIWKIDPEQARPLTLALYAPPPTIKTLVARAGDLSGQAAGEWKYTTTKPADGWEKPGFDDSKWQTGKGGFGTKNTPGAIIGTEWNGKEIWIRRTFEAPASVVNPHLSIHHDEDAQVYFNGEMVATFNGYTSGYKLSQLDAKAIDLLKANAGKQITLAVHCSQTTGGQYIDVGLVDVMPPKAAMGEKPKVYLAKFKGELGTDLTPQRWKSELEAAIASSNVMIIDFDVVSTPVPGQAAEARSALLMSHTDYAQYIRPYDESPAIRTVLWIRNARGAASLIPWWCSEIYMRPNGVIGGFSDMFKNANGEVRFGGFGSSLPAGHVLVNAEKSGYSARLVNAYLNPLNSFSYAKVNGEIIYLDREPREGEILLANESKNLLFDAELARTLGVSKGTTDSLPELLAMLQMPDAMVVVSQFR